MKALPFIALLSLGVTCNEKRPDIKVTRTEVTIIEDTDEDNTNPDVTNAEPTYVYICVSAGAKKYHYKPNCRGLSGCRHEIHKVKLEGAKENGKTLCLWEK